MVRLYNVVFSTRATDRLSLLRDYLLENSSSSSANKTIVMIVDKADSLSSFPNRYGLIGIKDYRSVSKGNYKIVYKVNEDKQQIDIVTIFDNRMNPDRLFKELG